MRCTMRLGLALAACVLVGRIAEGTAAPLRHPACEAVEPWTANFDPQDQQEIAPKIAVPTIFNDETTAALFGKPALQWSRDEIKEARRVINECARAARKRKDRATARRLGTVQGHISRLTGAINHITRARDTVETNLGVLEQQPDSPELYTGLAAVQAVLGGENPQSVTRGLPRQVAREVRQIIHALSYLPYTDAEALKTRLVSRLHSLLDGALAAARQAVAAAADSPEGLLAVRRTRFAFRRDYASSAPPEAMAAFAAAAEAREEAILATLVGESGNSQTRMMVPPTCLELYRWGAAASAQDFVQLPAGGYQRVFDDQNVLPVFHRSIARWTDEDFASYREVSSLCEEQFRWLTKKARAGHLAPQDSELLAAARAGRGAAGREREVRRAAQIMRTQQEAQQALAEARARLAQVAASAEGIAELNRLALSPFLSLLSYQERQAFLSEVAARRAQVNAALNAKREAAARAAANQALDELRDLTVERLADLGALWHAYRTAEQRLQREHGRSAAARLRHAFEARFVAESRTLLPAFQEALDSLPASAEGLERSHTAVPDLTGVEAPIAALQPYYEAAHTRSTAIAETLRLAACEQTWERLEVSQAEATQRLWGAGKPTTLGRFLCAMVENGNQVHEYRGGPLQTGDHTLKITVKPNRYLTVKLHTGEVQPGQEMLLGFSIADANQERQLSVAEWEAYVATLTGTGGGARQKPGDPRAACTRLAHVPESQLSVQDKMTLMECLMRFGPALYRGN
jgi:hypothetical protein